MKYLIDIKALLIGITSVIFLGLLFELVFLFVDIGYNMLMTNYPYIKIFRQGFYYLFVFAGLFFIMFTGGYLTAIYAKSNSIVHSVFVALITCAIALYATSSASELTLLSLLFVFLSIAFSLYGNVVYEKNRIEDEL